MSSRQQGGLDEAVVCCQLLPLLESCPVDRVVGQGTELPPFDVCVLLLSLPGLFKSTLENIPAAIPYLSATPPLVEKWRGQLSDLVGFRIGINWQGNQKALGERLQCQEKMGRITE